MLNVKEPHPGRCAEGDNREVDAEKRRGGPRPRSRRAAAKRMPALVVIVLSHGIEPPLRMEPSERQAVLDQERIDRLRPRTSPGG